MTSKSAPAGRFSLRRWSKRKLEAARAEAQTLPPVAAASPPPLAATPLETLAPAAPGQSAGAPLPPIESLTIESDFAPFFKPDVDESIRRAALKQLFRDPRFNIMDGLDTYIDDYTQPDPIPAAMLEGLMQRRVSFSLTEAEAPGSLVAGGAEADPGARAADAIAPPVAQIEPVLEVPVDLDPDKAGDTADPAPEGGIGTQTGKP